MMMKNAKQSALSKRQNNMNRGYMMLGFVFLAPAVLAYLVFMGYPLMRTFYVATTNWSGFGPMKFIKWDNFARIMADNTFWAALKNTLYFAIFSSIGSVIVGLLLAWLNLYIGRWEGQISRTVMFSPSMIAPTITGLLFMFIFTEDLGLLNNILKLLGLNNLTTAWLTNSATVRPVVVIATIWRQFGLTMVLCYAGLQNVPGELIESAKLDGAGSIHIFRRILLPLIKPQIELATMFTMLGGLRIYDSVVSLTGGGPARQTVVLPMWITENAFSYSKMGYASAMCVAFIAVVLIFIAVLQLVFRGESYEL